MDTTTKPVAFSDPHCDTFRSKLQIRLSLSLSPFTFHFLLTHPLTHSSLFLPLVFIPRLPSPPAPTNLSLLFYLPEGERFWITGLINKVNTGCQPLTQRCADRVEEERERGKQSGTPQVCKGLKHVCLLAGLMLEFCAASAKVWGILLE